MQPLLTSRSTLTVSTIALLCLAACGEADHDHDHGPGGHTHAPDSSELDGTGEDDPADEHDHGDEQALDAVQIGEHKIELAQGHGALEPGAESHLVVKLPWNDESETVVRAWVGTEDRTASMVGLGRYASAHDDYDIHADAPEPLPENVQWWIEIERPDGSKLLGAAKPFLE